MGIGTSSKHRDSVTIIRTTVEISHIPIGVGGGSRPVRLLHDHLPTTELLVPVRPESSPRPLPLPPPPCAVLPNVVDSGVVHGDEIETTTRVSLCSDKRSNLRVSRSPHKMQTRVLSSANPAVIVSGVAGQQEDKNKMKKSHIKQQEHGCLRPYGERARGSMIASSRKLGETHGATAGSSVSYHTYRRPKERPQHAASAIVSREAAFDPRSRGFAARIRPRLGNSLRSEYPVGPPSGSIRRNFSGMSIDSILPSVDWGRPKFVYRRGKLRIPLINSPYGALRVCAQLFPSWVPDPIVINNRIVNVLRNSWKRIMLGHTSFLRQRFSMLTSIYSNMPMVIFYSMMYQRMFHYDERMQFMFMYDFHQRGALVMQAFTVIMKYLPRQNTSQMVSYLRQISARHMKYGVAVEQYGFMAEAFVDCIKVVMGSDCTKEVVYAWRSLWGLILSIIIPEIVDIDEMRSKNNGVGCEGGSDDNGNGDDDGSSAQKSGSLHVAQSSGDSGKRLRVGSEEKRPGHTSILREKTVIPLRLSASQRELAMRSRAVGGSSGSAERAKREPHATETAVSGSVLRNKHNNASHSRSSGGPSHHGSVSTVSSRRSHFSDVAAIAAFAIKRSDLAGAKLVHSSLLQNEMRAPFQIVSPRLRDKVRRLNAHALNAPEIGAGHAARVLGFHGHPSYSNKLPSGFVSSRFGGSRATSTGTTMPITAFRESKTTAPATIQDDITTRPDSSVLSLRSLSQTYSISQAIQRPHQNPEHAPPRLRSRHIAASLVSDFPTEAHTVDSSINSIHGNT